MNEKKIYEKILKENEKYYYTDIKEIISNITEYKETTNTENLSYMKESVKKQNFYFKKRNKYKEEAKKS
jgi:formyltetrahydrofolate hydrolase